jgi:hypothetical protein
MYSTKEGAEKNIRTMKEEGRYKEVILYPRIKEGKLFGKHPFCVAARGRKR